MAIGIAGLMGVSRNTASQEADTHDDAQAYMAAEAGLFVGTSWFRDKDADAPLLPVVMWHRIGPNDNIPVTVSVIPDGANNVRLVSVADHPKLPYLKQLEWRLRAQTKTSGYYALYIDQVHSCDGATHCEGNYKGFRSGSRFDAPVHFNGPIWIKSLEENDYPIFRDIVTVYNPPQDGYYNSYGHTEINSYDYNVASNGEETSGGGLWLGENISSGKNKDGHKKDSETAIALDKQVFRDKFKVVKDKAKVEFDPSGITTDNLVAVNADNATLQFGRNATGASCTYCYTFDNGAPTGTDGKLRTAQIPTNHDPLIINADFPLTVKHGDMHGVVTVRTTPGNNIKFDLGTATNGGNLLYGGVNPNDIGITFSQTNKDKNYGVTETPNGGHLLAFYSGKDIDMRDTHLHQTRYITAQLFAESGQILVNLDHGKNYYRIVGVMCAKYWWVYQNNMVDGPIDVFFDNRKMGAPGIGYANVGGTGIVTDPNDKLIKTRWREINTPKS